MAAKKDLKKPGVEIDVDGLLSDLGLSKLRKGITARDIAPALVRFAEALDGANPLIRYIAREDLVHRLTKAGVRTPSKMLALAFGDESR